jgi:hypothetical protein
VPRLHEAADYYLPAPLDGAALNELAERCPFQMCVTLVLKTAA